MMTAICQLLFTRANNADCGMWLKKVHASGVCLCLGHDNMEQCGGRRANAVQQTAVDATTRLMSLESGSIGSSGLASGTDVKAPNVFAQLKWIEDSTAARTFFPVAQLRLWLRLAYAEGP